MPTPSEKEQDNRVSILINGKVHSAWSRYQIDSDFLIPADAWSVSLGLPDGVFPPGITRGVPVQVIWGEGDAIIPASSASSVLASLRRTTLASTG